MTRQKKSSISTIVIAFSSVLLAILVAYNYDESSARRNLKNNISRVEYEIFLNFKNQVKESIYSDKFSKAESLIKEFETTSIGTKHKHEVRSLKLLNNDRKLYKRIVRFQDMSDIAEYENNHSYGLYFSEVNEIKEGKEEALYLASSNSIEKLNQFIQDYPDSRFFYNAKGKLIKLKYEKERDSRERDLEFKSEMAEFETILKDYGRKDYSNDIYSYRSINDPFVPNNYSNPYLNPNSAPPIIHVEGYYKSNGTYVAPHVRTAPNDTKTDNLRYRKL